MPQTDSYFLSDQTGRLHTGQLCVLCIKGDRKLLYEITWCCIWPFIVQVSVLLLGCLVYFCDSLMSAFLTHGVFGRRSRCGQISNKVSRCEVITSYP